MNRFDELAEKAEELLKDASRSQNMEFGKVKASAGMGYAILALAKAVENKK